MSKAITTAKGPAKAKRVAGTKKPAHVLVSDHLKRMAAGPMPDDFGTQLSTYLKPRGAKSSKTVRARPNGGRKR